MPLNRFRITANGFYVRAQTWDDVLNWDGQGDEVFLVAAIRSINSDKTEHLQSDRQSAIMGDTSAQANVVKAGTLKGTGGLQSGDNFPTDQPWKKSRSANLGNNYPPMQLWEGELRPGERVVFVSIAIYESDPGASPLQDFANWTTGASKTFKGQISKYLGPTGTIVYDGIDLGLNILTSMDDAGILGRAATRPIGMRKSPSEPNKGIFTPTMVILNHDSAMRMIDGQPSGLGYGIIEVPCRDDSYYRGDYSLYLQVELVMDDGLVAKSNDNPTVYSIVGGGKLPIGDMDHLNKRYGGPSNVEIVPRGALREMPDFPKDETVIQEWDAPEAYVCLGGAKVWIPSVAELQKFYGPGTSRVVKVPNGTASRLPDQPQPGVIFTERTSRRMVQFLGNGNFLELALHPFFPVFAFKQFVVPDGTLARIL